KSRENSRCCGAGGGYKSQYNDFAVNVAADRIRDAEETGAEIIVTCCPFCVTNLSQGAKKIGSKIKIMDLGEVLLAVTAPVEAKPEAPKAVVAEPPKAEAKPDAPKAVASEPPKVDATPKAEPKPAVTEPPQAKAAETASFDDAEVFEDSFTDMSPATLVRRAAWNKGLRCRKDYGPYAIPVAFVKSKVAVYVLKDGGRIDASDRAAVENDGWAVLSFLEKDVTDGESQAAEIRAAVKENLKALRKKK
ncbi:MAG: hypothetical protein LBS92_04480, partial [Candidatus Methanoplasma sp.]|nr:hypothetical protein [Candidatus Methanoplasma sp.]